MKTGWGGLLLLAVAAAGAGCTRMSQATPRLSAELGNRISEMQGLHQLTLSRFFDAERGRVEEFLEREWIPLFLRNFLGTSGLISDVLGAGRVSEADRESIRLAVAEYLTDPSEAPRLTAAVVQAVASSRGREDTLVRTTLARFIDEGRLDRATAHVTSLLRSADPAILVLEWAGDAQQQITRMRRQLLDPLDAAERQATADLAQAYNDMAAANGAITGRLDAAARITARQDAMLAALGAGDIAGRTRSRLAAVSEAVGGALAEGTRKVGDGGSPGEVLRVLTDVLNAKLAAAGRER